MIEKKAWRGQTNSEVGIDLVVMDVAGHVFDFRIEFSRGGGHGWSRGLKGCHGAEGRSSFDVGEIQLTWRKFCSRATAGAGWQPPVYSLNDCAR